MFESKIDQLEILLNETNIDFKCIIISETWFTDTTFLGKFAINFLTFIVIVEAVKPVAVLQFIYMIALTLE